MNYGMEFLTITKNRIFSIAQILIKTTSKKKETKIQKPFKIKF